MRLDEITLLELLQPDPAAGIVRFADQRVLLFDAVALGLLRRDLIANLGAAGARGVLTRFGYAHGWRTAEVLRSAFPWESEADWRRAGGRLHALQGLVRVEPVTRAGDAPTDAEAVWHASYEAEQHVLLFGRADEPVCWTLCGFASGYMSFCTKQRVFFVEDRCVACGDAACHVVGRSLEAWGDGIRPHLAFFSVSESGEPDEHGGALDAALARVTEALKTAERTLRARKRKLGEAADPTGFVARDETMKAALDVARRAAKFDATVLVTGESGVGKERIARLLHDESARAHGPYVAVNCAAVAESLLESELFGHARGSFTGATQDRPGLFEAAHGGTLFLDEISEIPPSMQAKLLRTLQEREVRRVGENRSRPVTARVVAATNVDLESAVASGRFRSDLYYRLRVIEVKVPPLRARRADILPLARVLLAEVSRRLGKRVTGFTARAADQLLRYDWPGNVRELGNAIERAVVLTEGDRIDGGDLPEEVRVALPGVLGAGRPRALADVEREYILAVLERNDGNRARTAKELGIGEATLYRKLKEYGTTGAALRR
jgi:two-component system response regulator HydG